MEKSSKGISLKVSVMLLSILPLVLTIITLTIVSVIMCTSSIEKQTKESLKVASLGLKHYYEQQLATSETGEWNIEYDSGYVDHLLGDDINLTLFQGDVRFATSLKNEDGSRNEGTKANADIWAASQKGEDYYSDGVVIGGKDYFVYYAPLRNANNEVIGMAFSGKSCEQVKKTETTMLVTCLSIGIVVLIILVVLDIIVSGIIVKPFTRIAKSMQNMSEGYFKPINVNNSGVRETNMLLNSSKKLQNSISTVLESISNNSKTLYEKINELSALTNDTESNASNINLAVSELAGSASAIADNVQDINAEIIDLGQMIESISDSVNSLTDSTEKMMAANNEASEYIINMEKSNVNSVSSVKDIKNKVVSTNDAVTRISEAIDIITGIATQTNLLALNASIEAARAGEAGRGFAVVATEIGALAEQSNQSANEIKKIVDNISSQSSQSVEASEIVEQAIISEQNILINTKEKFAILNKEINTTASETESIAKQTGKVDSIKNSIIDSISNLSAISEENAAASQEVSSSVESISNKIKEIADDGVAISSVATTLDELVKKFTF